VLRALAANDERIVEYFRTISQGQRRILGTKPFSIDVPEGVEIDVEDLVNSLELQLWSRLAKLSWQPFFEARRFVQSLKLETAQEWRRYCKGELPGKGKLPEDIPANPYRVYGDQGWISMGDWLGTGAVAPQLRVYRPFQQARKSVHAFRLKSTPEWKKFCKGELPEKGILPKDIPSNPNLVYKDQGWMSWPDWFGTFTSARGKFRTFKRARKFVRGLGLKGQSEWNQYCTGELPEKGRLPRDIPSNPNVAYKNQGWNGMGDWLGTFSIASRFREYRPFREAGKLVRGLALKSHAEWKKYCKEGKLPQDIPVAPDQKYKDEGWVNWGDWLGTGVLATHLRPYRTFRQARSFVQSLSLKSGSEWIKYRKGELLRKGTLPQDIPSNPHHVYKGKGWMGMGDWLGTGTVATRLRQYRTFKQARGFVHSLSLKGSEWSKYCKGELLKKGTLPQDIPSNPQRTYKNKGWVSWPDWLGVAPRDRKYLQFQQARKVVHGLQLKTGSEYRKYCKGEMLDEKGKLPKDIPSNPEGRYKNKGWSGWPDWLGTDTVAPRDRKFRPFNQARKFVHGLGLRNISEWEKYRKGEMPEKGTRPEDIPYKPNLCKAYKKHWVGWPDWLGTSGRRKNS